MKAVRARIEQRTEEIAEHPFYAWIRSADSPLERRFDFAPALVTFIMGFSDMNRWFMRYPDASDPLRRAINLHTYEDEKHSALFVEDWHKLGLDERLGWGAGRTLARMHASPVTEPLRRDAQWILRMLVENEDPAVRFALMESIESWGHVVFAATADAASALTERTGVEYLYFGPYHLERELGTLIDGEELFDAVVFDEERRARALGLVDGLFDLAARESDRLLRYAREHVDGVPAAVPASARAPAFPFANERHFPSASSHECAVRSSGERSREPGGQPTHEPAGQPTDEPAGQPTHDPAPEPSAATRRLDRLLDEHRRTAASHPLLGWMVRAGASDPLDVLRRIAAFWAPDCLGYHDLTVHAVGYDAPAGAPERAITRWTVALGGHHELFLADWDALGMDSYLGLSASETLEHYFRSAHSETQRASAAAFVRLAHRHRDPLVRYWLLTALQASGDAFFAATRTVALRVEAEHGVRLDYLADRHTLGEPETVEDPEADAVAFRAHDLPRDVEATVAEIVGVVFDRLAAQMTASLAQVRDGVMVGR